MINRYQKIPLYHQIKAVLLTRINSMQADEAIPGEFELANEFNVSRGTVKQAIIELVNEGVLYRMQGKGTFVSPPKIKRSFGRLPTFTDDIRRLGYVPKSKKISLKVIEALEPVRTNLMLLESNNVIRFKRLVLANEKPVALVTSFLRIDIYPDLKIEDIDDSLYETLNKKYHKVPVKADDSYRPINANHDLAKILGISEGKAILYSERLSYLENNLPVEYVESYISGDIFTLSIKISPDNNIK
jgi:GntR family transcriptional regulator, N-acetylglucosamine utilization regulator